MTFALPTYPTLADVPRAHMARVGRIQYDLALVAIGSMLIAACAQVSIPLGFSPVPITGQTFAVLLIGALYGPWRGSATIVAYLLEGVAGLPVFAGFGAGPLHLLGPSGGYLLGFIVAALVVGGLARRGWDRRFLTTVAAMTLGTFAILAVGALWLARFTGPDVVLAVGVVPFLPGAIVKIMLAAVALPQGWRWVTGRRRA